MTKVKHANMESLFPSGNDTSSKSLRPQRKRSQVRKSVRNRCAKCGELGDNCYCELESALVIDSKFIRQLFSGEVPVPTDPEEMKHISNQVLSLVKLASAKDGQMTVLLDQQDTALKRIDELKRQNLFMWNLIDLEKRSKEELTAQVETLEKENVQKDLALEKMEQEKLELIARIEALEKESAQTNLKMEELELQFRKSSEKEFWKSSEKLDRSEQADASHDCAKACGEEPETNAGNSDGKRDARGSVSEDGRAPEIEGQTDEDDSADKEIKVKRVKEKGGRRDDFEEHLPRKVVDVPLIKCVYCGSTNLRLNGGERPSKSIDVLTNVYRVLVQVLHGYECIDCRKRFWSQAKHVMSRGFATGNALAKVVFDKFGLHIPYTRQSKRLKQQGIDISKQTLEGIASTAIQSMLPMFWLIVDYVLSGERIHADETTLPTFQEENDENEEKKKKLKKGYLWGFKRDDSPFGGTDPPAVFFVSSKSRSQETPKEWLKNFPGVVQTDAYAGYNPVFAEDRPGGAATKGYCFVHGRRNFWELTDPGYQSRLQNKSKKKSPYGKVAALTVEKIGELFKIEQEIRGLSPEARVKVREKKSKPLMDDLEAWLKELVDTHPKDSKLVEAANYFLRRWDGFETFLSNGRVCMDNNSIEREIRPVTQGRRAWLFAGSKKGAKNIAVARTIISTCELNGLDPQAYISYFLNVVGEMKDRDEVDYSKLAPWSLTPEMITDYLANNEITN